MVTPARVEAHEAAFWLPFLLPRCFRPWTGRRNWGGWYPWDEHKSESEEIKAVTNHSTTQRDMQRQLQRTTGSSWVAHLCEKTTKAREMTTAKAEGTIPGAYSVLQKAHFPQNEPNGWIEKPVIHGHWAKCSEDVAQEWKKLALSSGLINKA